MSRLNAIKKTWAMSRKLSAQRRGSRWGYFIDALRCSVRHGASPENYYVLRFYELDEKQRGRFLTSGRSKAVDAALNRRATGKDKLLIGRKELFNEGFRGLVRRDFLYVPKHDFEALKAFLRRHEQFMLKPTGGTMGRGIERLNAADVKPDELYERCREQKLLLEEVIRQHPALDAVNPSCVNTVRINAARGLDGKVRLIGACLKCGGAGAVTDNFHTGGVAYPLELETGKVTGPGRTNVDIKDCERHPGTDFTMPGFTVPCWQEVKACVMQGMDRVPSLGYVGWDVAVTPQGPELIEGNFHWPGGNIIQFDGVGKYPMILECLGERYEEHTD